MILSVITGPDHARQRAFRSRVWLDGVEVTDDCQMAIVDEPDEPGAVLLMARNAAGQHYVEAGHVVRAWHYGVVVVRPK